jgi:hypothetical protein
VGLAVCINFVTPTRRPEPSVYTEYSTSTVRGVMTILLLLSALAPIVPHVQFLRFLVSVVCPLVVAVSVLKSGLVPVPLPFLEEPRTGLVPESLRIQEPRTGIAKNRKKPVQTGCNQSRNEFNKTRAKSAKFGHGL